MILTRIIDGKPFQSYTQDWIDDNQALEVNGELVSNWILAPEYTGVFFIPKWNGREYYEAATPEEIAEANKPIIPEEISAMRLKLQLFDMGITDQDIFDDIDSIPDTMFSFAEKEKAKIMYKTAVTFERVNGELNFVATMKGLTQEQVDEIFINGNLL